MDESALADNLIYAYRHLDEEKRVNRLITQYYYDDGTMRRKAAQLQAEADYKMLLQDKATQETTLTATPDPSTQDEATQETTLLGDEEWRQRVILTTGLIVCLLVLSEVYL